MRPGPILPPGSRPRRPSPGGEAMLPSPRSTMLDRRADRSAAAYRPGRTPAPAVHVASLFQPPRRGCTTMARHRAVQVMAADDRKHGSMAFTLSFGAAHLGVMENLARRSARCSPSPFAVCRCRGPRRNGSAGGKSASAFSWAQSRRSVGSCPSRRPFTSAAISTSEPRLRQQAAPPWRPIQAPSALFLLSLGQSWGGIP